MDVAFEEEKWAELEAKIGRHDACMGYTFQFVRKSLEQALKKLGVRNIQTTSGEQRERLPEVV